AERQARHSALHETLHGAMAVHLGYPVHVVDLRGETAVDLPFLHYQVRRHYTADARRTLATLVGIVAVIAAPSVGQREPTCGADLEHLTDYHRAYEDVRPMGAPLWGKVVEAARSGVAQWLSAEGRPEQITRLADILLQRRLIHGEVWKQLVNGT